MRLKIFSSNKDSNLRIGLLEATQNDYTMLESSAISQDKKEVIKNLYFSGIGEEFIAMQLDLEIPDVIQVLKELGEYKS